MRFDLFDIITRRAPVCGSEVSCTIGSVSELDYKQFPILAAADEIILNLIHRESGMIAILMY